MAKQGLHSEDCLVGGLDAWRDDRENLDSTFIPIVQYRELAERHRCFLVGRRGSGKSAIAIMSQQAPGWNAHRVIEGESTQYGAYIDIINALSKLEADGVVFDFKRLNTLLWRYVLTIIIFQTVLDYCERSGTGTTDEANMIRRFLHQENYLNQNIGLILCDIGKELLDLVRERNQAFDAIHALHALYSESAVGSCKEVIPPLLNGQRILIVLDTLESYKIYSRPMKEALQGIVTAICEMLSDSNLSPVGIRFFLPAEVYEDVSKEMPAKVASDTVSLRWRFTDLTRMLSMRYLAMLERNQLADEEKIAALREILMRCDGREDEERISGAQLRDKFWYETEYLPKRVRNNRGDHEDTFAYIVRHTQRRPREFIFVINQIIREAFRRGELPNISSESVKDGLHQDFTLRTLLNDTLAPYDGYVKEIMESARAAFYGKPRFMSGAELRNFAHALYDLRPIEDVDPEMFAALLLRAGVIGLPIHSSSKGSGPYRYCEATFEYMLHDHVPFNKTLTYCVHPMLGDSFRMAQKEDDGTIYPKPPDDLELEIAAGIHPSPVG